jgi:epoxyqueuosine reductase
LLADLVALDEAGFRERFAGTALLRAKREGLARNACVALGNSGDPAAVPVLVQALGDASAVVRGHAAWALGRFRGAATRAALLAARELERDPEAREEMEAALTT